MDKYFAFDSFEGYPIDVNAPEDPQFATSGAKTSEIEFLNLLIS